MFSKKDYVSTQIGNPEGKDEPNKKYVLFMSMSWSLCDTNSGPRYYDPCERLREGENTMRQRVFEALEDFNAKRQL